MELPYIGKYCSNKNCKQLDFLPFNCDLCKQVFCNECRIYEIHDCPKILMRDKKATVCPMCEEPIIVLPGESADDKVWVHLQNGCANEKETQERTNRCQYRKCKRFELKPFVCPLCTKHTCVDHRLPEAHHCKAIKKVTTTRVRTQMNGNNVVVKSRLVNAKC